MNKKELIEKQHLYDKAMKADYERLYMQIKKHNVQIIKLNREVEEIKEENNKWYYIAVDIQHMLQSICLLEKSCKELEGVNNSFFHTQPFIER